MAVKSFLNSIMLYSCWAFHPEEFSICISLKSNKALCRQLFLYLSLVLIWSLQLRISLLVVLHRIMGRLDAAPVSFLWDHIVAGRSILPGAGMMAFVAASGRSLAHTSLQTSQIDIGFHSASIPAAVILTATPKTAPTLESVVDLMSGSIEVSNYPIGRPQSKAVP